MNFRTSITLQVFLHIGTDKTGSTSIQSALFRNRDWLGERSVYVPTTGLGRDNGHAALLNPFHDSELASLVRELITARNNGFASAVISWEGMVWYRRTRIHKLARTLDAFDIQVLVYLRDQAEIIQSGLLQRIKRKEQVTPIRALATPAGLQERLRAAAFIRDPGRNYYRILRRWQNYMPGAGFRVRVFDRSRLAGGDVVADFLQQLGVEIDTAFSTGRALTNPSLDVEGALLVESWRADPGYRDRMDTLIDITRSIINHEGGQTRYFLDEGAVRALRRHYRRANRRLAAHFSIDEDPLFPEVRASWRTETLAAIEARSQQLSQRVWEVNCVPTLPRPGAVRREAIPAHVHLYEGWSRPESWGVWSVGQRSRLRFRLPATLLPTYFSWLKIRLRGRYHATITSSRITVNGLDLGERDLSAADTILDLPLDALQAYEVVDISLEHASSGKRPPGGDKRDLAFALSAIAVTPQYDI